MTATVYDVARAQQLAALDGRLTSLEGLMRRHKAELSDMETYAAWLAEDIDEARARFGLPPRQRRSQ